MTARSQISSAAALLSAGILIPQSLPLLPILPFIAIAIIYLGSDRSAAETRLAVVCSSIALLSAAGITDLPVSIALISSVLALQLARSLYMPFPMLAPMLASLSIFDVLWRNAEGAIGPLVNTIQPASMATIAVIPLLASGLIIPSVAALFLTGVLGMLAPLANLGPESTLLLTSLPSIILVAGSTYGSLEASWPRTAPLVGLCAIATGSWLLSLPQTFQTIAILPPQSGHGVQQEFASASTVWRFVGIDIQPWTRLEEIPPKSLIVVPQPVEILSGFRSWDELLRLAEEHSWTVLAAGEHSDAFNSASLINSANSQLTVHSDISVPPMNSDRAGHLRVHSLNAFPWEGMLNRGASLQLHGVRARVLASGDGWYADLPFKNLAGALGNYRLDKSERRGSLPLIGVAIGNIRWIIAGDNSFLLDRFVMADPRALQWVLAQATLWPAFLTDIVFVAMLAATLFVAKGYVVTSRVSVVIAASVALISFNVAAPRPSKSWQNTYLDQSAHDPENFNSALVRWVSHFGPNAPLIRRHSRAFGGREFASDSSEIQIGLVREGEVLAGVRFSNCQRAGAVTISEKVNLMDGEICQIDGKAEVLLGSKSGASAVRIFGDRGRNTIVILDVGFLANRPEAAGNLEWLIAEVERQP